MRRPNLQKWSYSEEVEGLLFFAQTLDELLFYHTLDSFKALLTAWDAIGDLQDDDSPELRVRGKWADLLPSIPEGENYLWHTDRKDGLPLYPEVRLLITGP